METITIFLTFFRHLPKFLLKLSQHRAQHPINFQNVYPRIKEAEHQNKNKSQVDFINYCKSQLESTNDLLDEFDATAIAWAKKMDESNPGHLRGHASKQNY